MTAPRVAPGVVVAVVEVGDQICQVRDEVPGLLVVEVPQEPCEGVDVAGGARGEPPYPPSGPVAGIPLILARLEATAPEHKQSGAGSWPGFQ